MPRERADQRRVGAARRPARCSNASGWGSDRDRGYDADKTLAHIAQAMRAIATIPHKKHRTVQHDCDYAASKERPLVEYPT